MAYMWRNAEWAAASSSEQHSFSYPACTSAHFALLDGLSYGVRLFRDSAALFEPVKEHEQLLRLALFLLV